jgi:hypothetical protein
MFHVTDTRNWEVTVPQGSGIPRSKATSNTKFVVSCSSNISYKNFLFYLHTDVAPFEMQQSSADMSAMWRRRAECVLSPCDISS